MDNQNDFYDDQNQETENSENTVKEEAKMPTEEEKPLYETALEHPQKTVTYAMISLLSGIISLLCCCTGFGGLIFGAMAIVFFFVSKKHLGSCDFRSVIGLIFGVLGIGFSIFLVIAALNANPEEILSEMEQYMNMSTDGGFEV